MRVNTVQTNQAFHPPIRMVAVDLDGTLLNDAKQVSPQTVNALCSLPAAASSW